VCVCVCVCIYVFVCVRAYECLCVCMSISAKILILLLCIVEGQHINTYIEPLVYVFEYMICTYIYVYMNEYINLHTCILLKALSC